MGIKITIEGEDAAWRASMADDITTWLNDDENTNVEVDARDDSTIVTADGLNDDEEVEDADLDNDDKPVAD